MSELDAYFGPRKEVKMPPAKVSHFGRYPEVQGICDTFLTAMGWGHDAYTIGQVAAGARDYALAIGHDESLLLRAIKKMKREKLTIGSPRSCISVAREMRSPEEDTQKYLKGVDDE